MASSILAATGNSATSSTWANVDTTSLLNSEAGTTTIASTFVAGTPGGDSGTFTPSAITVDGVALKFATRVASPTGTLFVSLREVTTSTTSNTEVGGTKTFTVAASGLNINAGQAIQFFADSTHYMLGTVTSYIGTTLVVSIISAQGSGTFTSWTISYDTFISGIYYTNCTINATDIDAGGLGWHFFKFPASKTLLSGAGVAYMIHVVSSNVAIATLYRDASTPWTGATSNWSRMLRTTTTASPSANDQLYALGEMTGAGTGNPLALTWNGTTATNYGSTAALESIEVGRFGIFLASMAASSTFGVAWKGAFKVRGGGICMLGSTADTSTSNSVDTSGNKTFSAVDSGLVYTVGHKVMVFADAYNYMQGTIVSYSGTTLVITPTLAAGSGTFTSWIISAALPVTSTFTMMMNTAGISDTYIEDNGGKFITRGNPISFTSTKLTADAIATATALTTADSTGWKSGDVIALAGTTATVAQAESKALTADATTAGVSASTSTLTIGTGPQTLNALTATSTTNFAMGLGSQTLTVAPTGLTTLAVGYSITVANDATHYMTGNITAYTAGSGSVTVNVTTLVGTGTFSSWNIYPVLAIGQGITIQNDASHFMVGTITTYANNTGVLVAGITSTTGSGSFSSWNILNPALAITALGFPHNGLNDVNGDIRAELCNLTRNVKITATSTSLPGYIACLNTSVLDMQHTEVSFMGETANTAPKQGISLAPNAAGIGNIQYCSIHDFTLATSSGILVSSTGNVATNLTNNSIYNIGSFGIALNSAFSNNVDSNIIILSATGISTTSAKVAITNNTVANCSLVGITHIGAETIGLGAFSVNVMHSCTVGFTLNSLAGPITLSPCRVWRNTNGINLSNGTGQLNAILDSWILFGNTTSGFTITVCRGGEFTLKSCVFNAGVTVTQPVGLNLSSFIGVLTLDSCTFGAQTAHSTGDMSVSAANYYHVIYANNCLFASTTELANQSVMSYGGFISSQKHDQTVGLHKTWVGAGTLSIDTVIFNIASPSLRMTPLSAALKLESAPPRRGWRIPVKSGTTAAVSVSSRKSVIGDGTAYNGSQPRLICRKNVAVGILADTVLATGVAAAGNWEVLTGTTPSVTDDGTLEVICDCDGTTGWVNIDDRRAS